MTCPHTHRLWKSLSQGPEASLETYHQKSIYTLLLMNSEEAICLLFHRWSKRRNFPLGTKDALEEQPHIFRVWAQVSNAVFYFYPVCTWVLLVNILYDNGHCAVNKQTNQPAKCCNTVSAIGWVGQNLGGISMDWGLQVPTCSFQQCSASLQIILLYQRLCSQLKYLSVTVDKNKEQFTLPP